MLTTRNWNIDLTKALAMVLVVMHHTWSIFELDNPNLGVICDSYRAISSTGVLLFVFVSGALLLSRPSEPFKIFYKKRLYRLLIPFLFFSIVTYVISLYMGTYTWWKGDLTTAFLRFIPSLLENEINVMHWFVYMLLSLYLLTPFIQRALATISQREVEWILVVWIIGMILKQYYPSLNILSYTSALWTFLGIYIAGYYINQFRTNNTRYFYIGLIATLFLLTVNIFTSCSIYLGIPATAITIGWMCFNIPISNTTQNTHLGKFTTQISRYSYTTYLLHILLIRALYILIQNWDITPIIKWIPLIVTPIIILLFYIGCTIYDKTKWLPNNLVGIG